MSDVAKNIDLKKALAWLISLGIPLIIMLTPLTETYTTEIRSFCAITVLVILLMAFGLFNTMFLGIALPVLYTVCNVTSRQVALSAWENSVAYVVIGALLFATVLAETGVVNRVTFWCMQKTGGSFTKMLYIFLILGSIISYLTFGNTSKLMPTVAFGFCLALGIEHKKEGVILMMVSGVCSITARLLAYYPVQMGPMIAAAQTVQENFTMSWFEPLLYGLPIIPFMFLYVWVLTKIYKTKDSDLGGGATYFEEEYKKLGGWTIREKKCIVYALVIVLYLVTEPLHHLPADYAFMVLPWLAFLPGVGLGDSKTIGSLLKKMDIIFFIVGCLSIGIVGAKIGVTDLITNMLTPVFAQLSETQVMYTILCVGSVANMLLTPLALVTSFATPIVQIANGLGMSLTAPLLSLYYTVDMLFLPHEVPAYLYIFSFGVMSMKDFFQLHLLKNVMFLIFFGIIILPWWHLWGIF